MTKWDKEDSYAAIEKQELQGQQQIVGTANYAHTSLQWAITWCWAAMMHVITPSAPCALYREQCSSFSVTLTEREGERKRDRQRQCLDKLDGAI